MHFGWSLVEAQLYQVFDSQSYTATRWGVMRALNHQPTFATRIGNTIENMIPEKIPVINIAAANMPAVAAY